MNSAEIAVRPDYLEVSPSSENRIFRAIGLLNERGHGPIVVVPPFAEGSRITFLADGVTAETAGDRVMNPSAVRVPVAIALPRSQVLADLLSALASASFAGAESIWEQQAQSSGSDDQAFEVLNRKGEDPAAAVLAAHFLGRFAPRRTPVRWLHNLQSLLPDVADTYFLLAMRMMADELNAARPGINGSCNLRRQRRYAFSHGLGPC